MEQQKNIHELLCEQSCYLTLSKVSTKTRIAILKRLLKAAREEARTPTPADPRQKDLF